MATIDFPQSPNDGQIYSFANRTWTYNLSANAWIATTTNVGYTGSQGIGYTGSSGAAAAIGYTGSVGGIGYTGSSGAAVSVGYTGSAGSGGGTSVTISDTAPISPSDGSLWFTPTINTMSIWEASLSSWVVVSEGMKDDWGLVTSSATVYDDYGSVV